MLGLVVTDALFRSHPELPEGQLAKLRAAVVNMRALADVGRHLDIGGNVRLGRGEESTGGRNKSSILADTLEALLGAVYLDRGLDDAGALVHRLFDPLIEEASNRGIDVHESATKAEIRKSWATRAPTIHRFRPFTRSLVSATGPSSRTVRSSCRCAGRP